MTDDVDRIQDALDATKRDMRTRGSAEPDWDPLEAVLPMEHCSGFMFMGYAAGGIRMYKHGITRRYLMLLPAGEIEESDWAQYARRGCDARDHPAAIAFEHLGGHEATEQYRVITVARAIERAFEGIDQLASGVADPRAVKYDESYRAMRDAALAAAGWTVIS